MLTRRKVSLCTVAKPRPSCRSKSASIFHLASLPLIQGLADAQDDIEPDSRGDLYLLVDPWRPPWLRFALPTLFSKHNPKDEQLSSRPKSG
jgi:hypothetical protein